MSCLNIDDFRQFPMYNISVFILLRTYMINPQFLDCTLKFQKVTDETVVGMREEISNADYAQ